MPASRRGRAELHLPCALGVVAIGVGLWAVSVIAMVPVVAAGFLWLIGFGAYRYLPPTAYGPWQRKVFGVWLVSGALGGLVPVGVAYLSRVLGAADSHPVRHGDLFLLGSLLCFLGAGSIVLAEGKKLRSSVVVLAVVTACLGVLDVAAFNVVSSESHPSSLAVNVVSIVLYAGSALSNLGCSLIALGGPRDA